MRTDMGHGPEGHPDRDERVHFGFHDRGSDLCGAMRICLRRSRGAKEMSCHLMMPDGSTVGLNEEMVSDDASFEAKGLKFEEAEPGWRWRLSFRGGMVRTSGRAARKSHVELDLEFVGLNDVFGSSGPGMNGDRAGLLHDEQFGKVIGSLSTGLDEFEVSALGGRGHSRRVAEWPETESWTRLTCQFSEERALGLTRRADERGAADIGFVFADGGNVSLAQATLNVSYDSAKAPRLFDAALVDAAGGGHKVLGTVMRRIVTPLRDREGRNVATMHEALCRYNLSGSIGYGVAEHMVGQL